MSEAIDKPARLRDRVKAAVRALQEAQCYPTCMTPAVAADTSGGITMHGAPSVPEPAPDSPQIAIATASSSPCPPEWYSIGSSDIAALLGIDPHRTAVDVWLRLVHGVQQEDTPAMKAGREAEQWIGMRYRARHGIESMSSGTIVRVEFDGVPMRAQVDFEMEPSDAAGFIVETKCPHWSVQPRTLDPLRCPLHWWAQAQWQMRRTLYRRAVVRAEWGYQEDEGREWEVVYDPDWCDRVEAFAIWWWQEYVETRIAPPLTTPAEMAAVARAVYPRVTVEALADATAEEAALLIEAVAADETARAAKDYSEALRDRLRYAIRDRAGVVSPEARATYRPRKDGVRVLKIERTETDGR